MTLTVQILDSGRLAAVRRTGLLDTGSEEAFDRLTRLAATLLGTPYAFVTIVDDTRSFWKSCIGVDGPERQNTVQESFCQYVVNSGAELIVPDTRADPLTADNPSNDSMGVAAWAGFPVRSPDGHVLGTFCAVDTVTRSWTPHDIEVLKTLAQAAAGEIALREAADEARAAAARAEQLADTLQQSLLPPMLPEIPGVEVAVRYRRATAGTADVYGDFYDVFPSVRDAWAVVVGDVAGKGPQAAKVTALARYTLRAAAARCTTPSANLLTLNAALLGWYTDDPRFLTAIHATLRTHPDGISVRVSCGGHDPALIRRADGRIQSLGRHGLVLGWRSEPTLHDQRTVLRRGDSLVMFTDGVTEARRAGDRELFGPERLREVIAGTAGGSAEKLAEAIDEAVTTFTGGHASDDTAILVLHV
ncbi:serine phosphatase RsbU (regulator of sigma subunit) [Actinoplanes lutulentus]|uniref:Serine phosphatase RsbU (Regulator of sigma subunit) n=1 Tax=Actinoplanes lutulentus TaxID=1287878 RepID=A0A327Z598_9ACTN|nr:GAF domain-containing SpoIIE family protein phosphatase [Actinoplanes lutulentus]MBB2947554.1 serine phosphatase RsbU (regulator of sigma subunit) [Actinoplanes lutulentus]RAK25710.1 serine phosphatase RsbU (regulator of sigma subunit) [Actinoplanes lutulentus]